MSTVIIASIIIGSIVLICFSLIYVSNKQAKKKTGRLLSSFSQAGSDHQLSFSSQEIFKNKIIGLDGISRKLLVTEEKNEQISSRVVCLAEVKSCTLKKLHISVAGSSKEKSVEEHLSAIGLHFNFKNNNEPFDLIFYDNLTNHIYEMAELEAKANDWKTILSKMLTRQTKERA